MIYQLSLAEDMHVHSNWSDGANSILENVRAAETRGLKRLGCVDHVRRDTDWFQYFAAEVRIVQLCTDVHLFACAETKLLNEAGDLDMPENLEGTDYLYIADHQFPLGDRCYHPKDIREMLKSGELSADRAINSLCRATINAIRRYDNVVIAHLFSILPKVGLDEAQVPDQLLREMAANARIFGAKIEIDERWKCPAYRTVTYFKAQNVPIWFSSDSHRRETIGRYSYNSQLFAQIL